MEIYVLIAKYFDNKIYLTIFWVYILKGRISISYKLQTIIKDLQIYVELYKNKCHHFYFQIIPSSKN